MYASAIWNSATERDDEPQPLRLPRDVGPYTLFAPIGRGGMAELFLARRQTELGATRRVVVKLILPAFADDPRFSEMLVREAKLAAGLSHRHVVQVFDLGRHEDHLFIAMEHVEGLDLAAIVRLCAERNEPLPLAHALAIVSDVLEGLDHAHRRRGEDGAPLGLVHRDVSPSNVLVSYEGEVKLCDFGIAHANEVHRHVSEEDARNEALKGKAGYMSPEHARAEPLDARADVFAAGILLWELLAGRRLYLPKGPVPLLEQARLAVVPPLPERGIPEHAALEAIVRKALSADVNDRYPSAAAFARALEDYLVATRLLASRRELGAWLTTTFGTALSDELRLTESQLPPARPSSRPVSASGVVRRSANANVVVPPAPKLPTGLESIAMADPTEPPAASDDELIRWARKRGWVTFGIFCFLGIATTTVFLLVR